MLPTDRIHAALTGEHPTTLARLFGTDGQPADIVAGHCDTCGHGCYLVPGEPAVCVMCIENMAVNA